MFLSKILNIHSTSLHPGVERIISNFLGKLAKILGVPLYRQEYWFGGVAVLLVESRMHCKLQQYGVIRLVGTFITVQLYPLTSNLIWILQEEDVKLEDKEGEKKTEDKEGEEKTEGEKEKEEPNAEEEKKEEASA